MLIRTVQETDANALCRYYAENRDHFKPWQPHRPTGYHSLLSWQLRIQEYIKNQEDKKGAHFIAIDEKKCKVIAHCNLSQIFYGPFKACYMGYGVSVLYQGNNVMYRTCLGVIHHAFNILNLHRIMANYMPHNNRSRVLLKRLGFAYEGLAKDYLKINGKWENHILTSLTNKKIR